jgi:hypothetical protein
MRKTRICIVGEDDQVILDKKLTALPLKEEFVIKRSIEFFNDPAPCMIHRSAVLKRTYMEFFEYFSQLKNQGKKEVFWEQLPPVFKEALNLKDKPFKVKFC